MTEAQIKEAERQKALEMIAATEKYLGNLYGHLNMFCTGEEQDYRDPHDNVERCMQMVLGQVMEAWTHAGRARKRLIALHQAEPSSPASSPKLEAYVDPSDIHKHDIGIPGYEVQSQNTVLRLRQASEEQAV